MDGCRRAAPSHDRVKLAVEGGEPSGGERAKRGLRVLLDELAVERASPFVVAHLEPLFGQLEQPRLVGNVAVATGPCSRQGETETPREQQPPGPGKPSAAKRRASRASRNSVENRR